MPVHILASAAAAHGFYASGWPLAIAIIALIVVALSGGRRARA